MLIYYAELIFISYFMSTATFDMHSMQMPLNLTYFTTQNKHMT